MQINLSGHHVDITPAIRQHVETKFEKLERHFDHMTSIHVILTVEKDRHKAEAKIHVSGADLYADEENENMYAAIDSLTDKLDRQVKKHKEKLTDHHRGQNKTKA